MQYFRFIDTENIDKCMPISGMFLISNLNGFAKYPQNNIKECPDIRTLDFLVTFV